MHEMSIAMAVVEQVAEAAGAHGAHRVAAVRVQIGELAGVVPEALGFCFELACAETPVEGAELHIESVAGRAGCAGCDARWLTGMPPDLCCPRCGGARTELLAGRELQILGVDWADTPVPAPADQEG
ncbi:hydrogenase maturation nickel metallochaperone HypA [Kitasatospora sp. NPDC088351]|uniref:hydrogenase maturation nickel metallochaperone HypA n=1 Tax=unclassified Kitasatospora TaxID=2633591 RepID=UPI0034465D02